MTTYFIDFQNGCDENDGLRPETPFRTQHPELLKPDDTVLFRRGTMFRGPLQNPSGRWEHPIHYGAYGEGEPPVFCGSQSLSDPAQWESIGGNVWKYTGALSGETANLIYGDGTCGALRWSADALCEQGDWFDSCLGYSIQQLPLAEDHTLLVYSQENPAAFYGSIECATSQYRWLAHCGHDMVISDLEFRNNGLHGIAGEEGGRNLRIENCRFAKIGGAVWEKDQKIRFGNAFECWNVAENVEVEHCVFDDIYDSAVTHQGGADCKPAYHFLIRSNTFRRCGMAAYEQRDLLPTYAEFTENVCEDAGEGFSRLGETMPRRSEIWPQPMGHHVFLWRISHATGNEHFALCRNTFGDAPYGAAVYSVNPSEADRLVHLEENRYPMQRYTLVGRMYGIDYPDPSAWESRRKEESERESSMKVFTVALIGAGNRGEIYTDIMKTLPEKFRVVAVADPNENHRRNIQNKHSLPDNHVFHTWQELLAQPGLADLAVIATQDSMHYEPAMKALAAGYDVLLEKPLARTEEECIELREQARKYGRKFMVCHVLRYTPFYSRVKQLIDEGVLGDIVTIVHTEGLGNIHQSHSFVRGNWGNTAKSNFMLLAKSCHDIDLLQWLMKKKCTKIQSFGSLKYFRRENAPADAPERCIDGCPHAETCPYNAVKLYLDDKNNMWFRTTSTGKVDPTDADVEFTLRHTQYGKCVFKCDNDVVDHQVVNMEFDDKSTASFTMSCFNYNGRKSNIMGTKGEMFLDFEGDEIRIFHFEGRWWETIHTNGRVDGTLVGGHGGGDPGIVNALYDYMTGAKTADEVSEIGISCENTRLVFAAERSRLNGDVETITPLA